ncbi:hypothetical protein AB0F81_29890 [Actinoplanes sp. NPDC024001]|uniref:hypothetical protein n=1 Tax=Actinoplanes sp. NPDC024001 TaxID=3154598 RepID=UPI0033C33EF4
MSQIVEIHVPLLPGKDVPQDSFQFPWIEQVEDHLIDLEDELDIEVYDEAEEIDDSYVFFIAGGDEQTLLTAASRVAALDGVPPGSFAMVTDEAAESIGMGRRVTLPIP